MNLISAAAFLGCLAAVVVCGVLVRHRHPDASTTAMFDRLMSDRAVRLAVIVIWWWLGWHFLAGQTL